MCIRRQSPLPVLIYAQQMMGVWTEKSPARHTDSFPNFLSSLFTWIKWRKEIPTFDAKALHL